MTEPSDVEIAAISSNDVGGLLTVECDASDRPPAGSGELAQLLHACVLNGASLGLALPFTQADASAFWRGLSRSLMAGESRLFVAHIAQASPDSADRTVLAGLGLLILEGAWVRRRSAQISMLLVAPHCRRRGIGSALLTATEELARERGRDLILLDTVEDEPEEAFFSNRGYQRFGRIPSYAVRIDGLPATAIFLYKDLRDRPLGAPGATPTGVEAKRSLESTAAEQGRLHGFSAEAVGVLLEALRRGYGQAQFSHPELGGLGQWSNGMTMIGTPGDTALRRRVGALAQTLAALLREQDVGRATLPRQSKEEPQRMEPMKPMTSMEGMAPMKPMEPMPPMKPMEAPEPWWPSDLGEPASTGAQNDRRYASFPDRKRLLVQQAGRIQAYDSGDLRITGFGQSQSSSGTEDGIVLSTDGGPVALTDLKLVD